MKNLSEIEFKNSLPIVSHGKTYIHYVRIEMNEKNRFSTVLKVLAR